MPSLNAPGTQTPFCRSILELDELNSLFSQLVLWGNKNWAPSMKVKETENLPYKMGSKGSKWPSLNAPGTQTPLSPPILELDEFPFPTISPLG